MKKILVPIDFSNAAEHAVQLALELVKSNNATLYLLHVIEYDSIGLLESDGTFAATSNVKTAVERLLKRGEIKLTNYIQNLHVHGADIKKQFGLGVPEEVIVQNIEELDIDLVVMGTHGASGLQELFIGSIAEKVVRNAKCPVITVKHKTSMNDIKHIIFGNDLIDLSDHVIAKLKQLQELFRAKLTIIRVNTPGNFERDEVFKQVETRILKRFKSNNITIQNYNDKTVEEGFRHFAEENGAGIIALATHGRTGLSHFITGSIAENLVNHTTKAVWTCHL